MEATTASCLFKLFDAYSLLTTAQYEIDTFSAGKFFVKAAKGIQYTAAKQVGAWEYSAIAFFARKQLCCLLGRQLRRNKVLQLAGDYIGLPVKLPQQRGKRAFHENIVMIEEDDEFPPGVLQPLIAGARGPDGGLPYNATAKGTGKFCRPIT